MAIAFISDAEYTTVATTATYSSSFTCPSTTDGILMVGVNFNNPRTVNSITFNGQNLTKAVSYTGEASYSNGELWYLVNPPATTANIVVTLNSSVSGRKSWMAQVYEGVDQTTPINTTNSSYVRPGTAASISLTTTVDDCWLVGHWKSDTANFTAGADTVFRAQNFGSELMGDSNGAKNPAGTYSLNATLASTGDKGINAAAIAPVGGGGSLLSPLMLMGMGS
jgi:hypothetical protein